MGYKEPGIIMTKNDAADYLRGTSNVAGAYKNLENQLATGANQIQQSYLANKQIVGQNFGQNAYDVGADLASSMETAFANVANQRYNLMTTNVGQGTLALGNSDIERAASAAYDNYIRNYTANRQSVNSQLSQDLTNLNKDAASALQTLQNNVQTQMSSLDKMVDEEAANYSALYNSPMEYLQWLANEQLINESDANFGKYFTANFKDGQMSYSLRDKQWFDDNFYALDANGNRVLSQAGKDFYNQILYGTGDMETSFNDWLYGTNEDLYNWANSESSYGSYKDAAGNKTNIADVFGQVGADVSRGVYEQDKSDIYKEPNPIKTIAHGESNNLFGEIKFYDNVATYNDLSISGDNWKHVGDINKTEQFTIKYKGDNGTTKVHGKVVKNGNVLDDASVKKIYNKVGKIEDKKLYYYNDTYYVAYADDTGKILMREFIPDLAQDLEKLKDPIKKADVDAKSDTADTAYELVDGQVDGLVGGIYYDPITAGTKNIAI